MGHLSSNLSFQNGVGSMVDGGSRSFEVDCFEDWMAGGRWQIFASLELEVD
jgi:hypothetical protein